MLKIQFEICTPADEASRDRVLRALLWCLVTVDREYLRTHPYTPPLYSAGVRYLREPEGFEQWPDIGRILEQGGGDCEDLACWRVAELRQCGIAARPAWRHRKVESVQSGKIFTLYHILVWTPNGYEDPSARLGMMGDG